MVHPAVSYRREAINFFVKNAISVGAKSPPTAHDAPYGANTLLGKKPTNGGAFLLVSLTE